MVEIETGSMNLNVLPDLGSYFNIIDKNTWEMQKSNRIKCDSCAGPPNEQLYSYTSEKPLEVKGTFECDIKAGKGSGHAEFVVVKGHRVPLIGHNTAMNLGMMKIGIDVNNIYEDSLYTEFIDVFSGLSKFKDTEITIHTDPPVKSVVQPLHKTSLNQQKDQLWVNSAMIVPKPGVI
ncbi:uncharacterized protein LOC106176531 [Lingula anatina]|uniref:Uncharacterized protein LOC106176531 n=1 Tax=Lingula anatina TaxID=7574 RepID=A0A1S3JVV2_LINAN|nr:uncharacterized protein LOC106176531 [Lingula anatina]|eukprot:XP_013414422.1 uncharacterized protein LOC106176531 [Lingula anatina]